MLILLYMNNKVITTEFLENMNLGAVAESVFDQYYHAYSENGPALAKKNDFKKHSLVLSALPTRSKILDMNIGAGQLFNCLVKSNKFRRIVGQDKRAHSKLLQISKQPEFAFVAPPKGALASNEVDYVVVHGLLEKMSRSAMEMCISEARRMAKKGVVYCLPFNETAPLENGRLQRFTITRLETLFPNSTFTAIASKRTIQTLIVKEGQY